MLFKKSIAGRKYMRLMTGSPILFISFVLFGTVLLLFLSFNTRIDVTQTYPAAVLPNKSGLVISDMTEKMTIGEAYIYFNKSEAVFPVSIERVEYLNDNAVLYFSNNSKDILNTLPAQNLSIEIPKGNVSLLYKIFVTGGKSHGR